ncbi:MAG TPA: tetratricopeptide repeat protein [Gemmataceae bacterium]|jgi:tetratricopeptide (TPR) repeat protein
MGRTLNLCECLLHMGRDWQSAGRLVEASRVLLRLAGFRDLPAVIAEEAHARLATIFLQLREFKKARRHLTSVLFFRPSHAPYYFQLASALHHDDEADPFRAVRYYRQALRLDPDQPRWWADFGRLLLQTGKTQKGVGALRKAVSLDADDPVIVGRLVEGLCLADRCGEARKVLREARFRHPRDARFRKLWNDFQFRQVSESQGEKPVAPEPVILPFVRRASLPEVPQAGTPGRIVRLDQASKSAPHLPRPAWLPDTKHAP